MLTVNISSNVGTSTNHRHSCVYLEELSLKREFALQILNRKCADKKKCSTHIFILVNSKCHKSKFKETGKLIHFQPKANFQSCFPRIFISEKASEISNRRKSINFPYTC